MIKNRGIKNIKKISDGPGKLTIAFGITKKEHSVDMTKKSSIYIEEGIKPKKIKTGPRIGISKGLDKMWNFSINPKDYF